PPGRSRVVFYCRRPRPPVKRFSVRKRGKIGGPLFRRRAEGAPLISGPGQRAGGIPPGGRGFAPPAAGRPGAPPPPPPPRGAPRPAPARRCARRRRGGRRRRRPRRG